MLNKLNHNIMACDICPYTSTMQNNNVPLMQYFPCLITVCQVCQQMLSICQKELRALNLLVVTCKYTNFVVAKPLKDIQAKTISEALIHRVITIFGIPNMLVVDKDRALTGQVINCC